MLRVTKSTRTTITESHSVEVPVVLTPEEIAKEVRKEELAKAKGIVKRTESQRANQAVLQDSVKADREDLSEEQIAIRELLKDSTPSVLAQQATMQALVQVGLITPELAQAIKQDEADNQAARNLAQFVMLNLPILPSKEYARKLRIGPKEAMILLATNGFMQRERSMKRIKQYQNDIEKGKWKNTCEPIKISWFWFLLDGQNRLWAIVYAGVAVDLWVYFDVDPSTYDCMDGGWIRSAKHLREADGDRTTLRNCGDMGNLWFEVNKKGHPIPKECAAFLTLHPEYGWARRVLPRDRRQGEKGVDKASVRLALAEMYMIDPAKARLFADYMKSMYLPSVNQGVMAIPAGCPVIALFKVVKDEIVKGEKTHFINSDWQMQLYGQSVHAMKLFLDDKTWFTDHNGLNKEERW